MNSLPALINSEGCPLKTDKKIRLLWDDKDEPWFVGCDIANILGYQNEWNAIDRYVEDEDRCEFGTPRFTGSSKWEYAKPHTIMINEHGLYALALGGNKKERKAFKKWVYSVLVKLRKDGYYSLQKELEEEKKEKNNYKYELEQKDIELEKATKKALRIQDFIDNVSIREKNEWIYIATTEQYASNNRFKVGSTKRLAKRLSPYNTGRIKEDPMYYCWISKCYCSSKVDEMIKSLLSDFRDKKNSEMYIMNFDDLVDIVEFISENFEKSVEYVNSFVKNRLAFSSDKEPVIPKPIEIEKTSLVIKNINDDQDEIIDLTNLSTYDKERILREKLDLFQGEITRKEVLNLFKGNKMELWNEIKRITNWKNSKTQIDGIGKELVIKYK